MKDRIYPIRQMPVDIFPKGAPVLVAGGMRVFVSDDATTEGPRFPDKKWTKRRRRRVIGKFGSWTVRKPAAFRAGPTLYVHPAIYAEMRYNNPGG